MAAVVGAKLLGSYLNKRSSDKASAKQQKNLQAALAQLTPEAIQRLTQMFYTQNYAQMMPQMQMAQQGLSNKAGRYGLTGAGVVQQLKAGIPGQFTQSALGTATSQALGVSGQRAGIYSGAPVTAPYSFGNDLNSLMQMIGRYGFLRNQKSPAGDKNPNEWWIEGPGKGPVYA